MVFVEGILFIAVKMQGAREGCEKDRDRGWGQLLVETELGAWTSWDWDS